MQLVPARRLEELGADDDVVVDRRRLFQRVEALGGRGRRQLGCHGLVRNSAVTEVFSVLGLKLVAHVHTLHVALVRMILVGGSACPIAFQISDPIAYLGSKFPLILFELSFRFCGVNRGLN